MSSTPQNTPHASRPSPDSADGLSTGTGNRFPELAPEAMTPAQQRVAANIVSGPRGKLIGPFNAWLRSPELADRLQKVGEYIRFNSSLPTRLNELAILITARSWGSQFEWWAHAKFALDAGLDSAIVDAIAAGRRPERMAEDETIIYDFCTQLRREKAVSDANYERMRAAFGEQGIVDVIAASGYYDLVSMTLNVAEIPMPAGATPLAPLDKPYP
jgi:4-carboxymuconolactone decarboxylase